jgi:hypothetical protein
MSFELELLWLGRDGNAIVVCGEQSPLDMSFAKLRAQQIFDGARKNGGPLDAIRIRKPWRSSIETRVGVIYPIGLTTRRVSADDQRGANVIDVADHHPESHCSRATIRHSNKRKTRQRRLIRAAET